jgi:hypothetical protein
MLDLAGEWQVRLGASRVPHLGVAGDLGAIEHRHRDRKGERDRVTEIDERMDPREEALFAVAAQQRFRRATVLSRPEAHSGEGPPPGLDLGQLAFRAGGEARLGDRLESSYPRAELDVRADGARTDDSRDELRIVAPDVF